MEVTGRPKSVDDRSILDMNETHEMRGSILTPRGNNNVLNATENTDTFIS